MNKVIFTISILLLLSFLKVHGQTQKQAQESITFIGAGVSFFNEDVKESSNTAFHFDFCFYNFYFDFASNLASGKGTELDYQSSQTSKLNKMQINIINVGYAVRLNKLSLFPIVGYGWTMDIYEDPIAFDTYYYDNPIGKFNLGAKAAYLLSENVGLLAGFGTYEKFNIAIWLRF